MRHALALLVLLAAAPAAAAVDPAQLAALAGDDPEARVEAVRALAGAADPGGVRALRALAEGRLRVAGGRVLEVDGGRLLDAASGAPLAAAPGALEEVPLNNRLRRELAAGLAACSLSDPDRAVRLAAAQALAEAPRPEAAPALARALAEERDPAVRRALGLARGLAELRSADPQRRRAAAAALAASDQPAVKALLERLQDPRAEPDAGVRAAARAALQRVELRVAAGQLLASAFTGLSLGSVLLLVALGLAITYGVMGVINMAHGELLMIGAYAAYAAQALLDRVRPGAGAWSLLLALPAGFLAAAVAGAILERAVIRRLYHRPLETLLATWGLSLVLIQAARMVFGAQNVQVRNPGWMSGGLGLWGGAVLPWNRVALVAFALAVLLLTWLVLTRTRLGLHVRAVTQDRAMAACLGVPTGRVDTAAFALGAGIAGLGGVALSQIANVGPDMGQAYVVDAFMVVVLGGVGQLAGTLGAALGLGVVGKLLEGWAGAVLAKILVLALVIAFIQRRPRGLFALAGRQGEA